MEKMILVPLTEWAEMQEKVNQLENAQIICRVDYAFRIHRYYGMDTDGAIAELASEIERLQKEIAQLKKPKTFWQWLLNK